MTIFGLGGKCKQMIKYDGTSLDLSGVNVSTAIGTGPLSVALGSLNVKHELLQTAAEIAQLIDAVQFSNCIKIEQTPKDSKERIQLIHQAMEAEKQLIQFSIVFKLISSNPTSEPIQKALAEWVASQASRTQELEAQVQDVPVPRGSDNIVQIPSRGQIELSIQKAKAVDSHLNDALQRGATFDFGKILDTL